MTNTKEHLMLRRVAHLELSKPDLRELPADQAGEQQKHEHEGELGRGGTAFPPAHQIRMTRKCCGLRYEGRGWSSASVSIPEAETRRRNSGRGRASEAIAKAARSLGKTAAAWSAERAWTTARVSPA